METKPRLVIELNPQTLEASFAMNCAPILRGTMIGACEMAKSWILNGIIEDNKKIHGEKNLLAKKSPLDENPNEKEVTRDAALDLYASQMWELQERIRAVRDADSRATFKVPLPRH